MRGAENPPPAPPHPRADARGASAAVPRELATAADADAGHARPRADGGARGGVIDGRKMRGVLQ
jgi:hypothetical protein